MQLVRVGLAIVALIAIAIGTADRVQAAAVADASVSVAHVDTTPDAYVAVPALVEPVTARRTVTECAVCVPRTHARLLPVLSSAPKTSPPWMRS